MSGSSAPTLCSNECCSSLSLSLSLLLSLRRRRSAALSQSASAPHSTPSTPHSSNMSFMAPLLHTTPIRPLAGHNYFYFLFIVLPSWSGQIKNGETARRFSLSHADETREREKRLSLCRRAANCAQFVTVLLFALRCHCM